MNTTLLPSQSEDFSKSEYWNSFFSQRGSKSFEWYGSLLQLLGIFSKYIKNTKDEILVIGCGNSTLSCDLIRLGYSKLISIDNSTIVVRQMSSEYPKNSYKLMDVTKSLEFEKEAFHVVIDKGTLDALFTTTSEDVVQNIDVMFSEIKRVLKFGGRYICVSLLQPHILEYLVNWSSKEGFPLRIIRCREVEESRSNPGLPVFVIVLTKFKKMSHGNSIYELSLSSSGAVMRQETKEDLMSSIIGLQQFSAFSLSSNRCSTHHESLSLDLRSPGSQEPCYSLFNAFYSKGKNPFGVFIVPQGRETEWLFSSFEGRETLAASSNVSHLIVVHLLRERHFHSLNEIQSELSSIILEILPPSASLSTTIPYLSLGDETVGERRKVSSGSSSLTGSYFIEDVTIGDQIFRRLYFLSNPHLIQSEVQLRKKKGKRGKPCYSVDNSVLSCLHHAFMIGALELFSESVSLLIVGLGGGSLPTFIQRHFPKSQITVVELDEEVVKIASTYFGFHPQNFKTPIQVFVQDGLNILQKMSTSSQNSLDVLMIDVDSKNSQSGLSCPPEDFLKSEFLTNAFLVLRNSGLLMINLVCRDSKMKKDILTDISSFFPQLFLYSIPEEVNCIVYAFKRHETSSLSKLSLSFAKVNSKVESPFISEALDFQRDFTVFP